MRNGDTGHGDDERPQVLSLPNAPDAIELRHLRAFVAVAEELNFARAAEALYLSAPALSRQIRTLERLLGCELFRRTTRQVELTLAGEALLDGARRVLAELDSAVTVTRSVGGELAGRIAQFWTPTAAMYTAESYIQRLRNDFEAMLQQFAPPPDISVRSANAGGVPSLLLTPRHEQPPTLLYLHGGVYVLGSAYGYQPIAGALAIAADATVLLPEYRLAPENPFPAAIEDAVRAYLWMLDQGVPASQITVAGDVSGAGLALSLLLTLRHDGQPLPGGSVLFCPGVDMTCSALVNRPVGSTALVFDLEQVRTLIDCYLDGHPIDDPLVAPLHTDLTGLPPMLIQVGTGDPLIDEARRLANHAREHGIKVDLELYPVDTHGFQLFWSFLPEAADALRNAGEFIRHIHNAGADAHTA